MKNFFQIFLIHDLGNKRNIVVKFHQEQDDKIKC